MPDLDATMQALAERLADEVCGCLAIETGVPTFTGTAVRAALTADAGLRALVEFAYDRRGADIHTHDENYCSYCHARAALARATGSREDGDAAGD